MIRFATDGIVSFSSAPLRMALVLGFIVSVLSVLGGFLSIALRLAGVYAVSGWASLMVAMTFLGGVQLIVLGVIGAYIARIHEEVKGRPLYLVRDRIGGDGASRRGPDPLTVDVREAFDT
jgi:dolichol-phosphate mannosyltransferase